MATKEWIKENRDRVRAIKTRWNRKNKEYYVTWRGKNKVRLSERRTRNREFANDYLRSHPCLDCGEADFRCLDFDHVNGDKKYSLGNMKNCGYSLETIQKEMDKCVIRCSNCHRKKHYLDKYPSMN